MMRMLEDGNLVTDDGKPMFLGDKESELAFLRNKYNENMRICNQIEAEARKNGTVQRYDLMPSENQKYRKAKEECAVICAYISFHDIDYGEIDPETGLIVEKQR